MSRRRSATQPAAAPIPTSRILDISPGMVSRIVAMTQRAAPTADSNPFRLPDHPPGNKAAVTIAQDDALVGNLAWGAQQFASYGYEGVAFLGWTQLAEMAQRPEYRRIVETIAGEMVRRWIKVTARGDDDKSDKVAKIEAEFHRLGLRDACRRAVEGSGYFGRGHVFLDFGTADPGEITTDVGVGADQVSRSKVGRDRPLKAIRVVEGMWASPMRYNTSNPLDPNWYRPEAWSVQGREVHASRLLTFVGHEVPDLLKAAYSFGGLPLTQMAKPYVDNWLRTRQSVSDLIAAFSVRGIKTDLVNAVNSGSAWDALMRRVQVFNATVSNLGTMILDKAEEFFNVSTPLGTLDKLQAQAQEQMFSSVKIPLVKGTGLQPSGLNATSEGELDSWNDDIRSAQEIELRPNITRVLGFVQMSLFGEVDPDIGFEFEPLDEMDEKERAELQEIQARTGETLVRSGAVTRDEERNRVATSFGTPYPGLDLSKPVPPPESERIDNATKLAASKIATHEAALTTEKVALQGLADTGIFPEITAEVIAEADDSPPRPSELDDGAGNRDPVTNPLDGAERAGRLSLGTHREEGAPADA